MGHLAQPCQDLPWLLLALRPAWVALCHPRLLLSISALPASAADRPLSNLPPVACFQANEHRLRSAAAEVQGHSTDQLLSQLFKQHRHHAGLPPGARRLPARAALPARGMSLTASCHELMRQTPRDLQWCHRWSATSSWRSRREPPTQRRQARRQPQTAVARCRRAQVGPPKVGEPAIGGGGAPPRPLRQTCLPLRSARPCPP